MKTRLINWVWMIIVFSGTSLSSVLMAGNESHGGNIVVCENAPPVVLDYFHASLKGFGEEKPNIIDISSWSTENVVLFFRNSLKNFLVRFEFESALFQLGEVATWIEADLKEVNDSDEPYFLPKGCVRKQGAVRQGNQVFIDPTYTRNLTPAQLGILQVHESLLYVANSHGRKTSVEVRELVRALMRKDTPHANLMRAIHGVGGLVYAFELLPEKGMFQSTCGGSSPKIFFEHASASTRTIRARGFQMEILPNEPAEFHCDTNGTTCSLVKATNISGSVLSWQGAKMEIRDGGRQLVFNSEHGTCLYYRPMR